MDIVFDYRRLRGKIREVYDTERAFAKALKIGRVSLSHRLNNKLEFTAKEIYSSCTLLAIPLSEIPSYFFTERVQKCEHSTSSLEQVISPQSNPASVCQ